MEKLELKHLAPYLPYELKFVYYDSPIDRYILELKSCSSDYVMCPDTDYNYNYIKPILRPLSDLTKQIKHKENVFYPIGKLHNISYKMRGKKSKGEYEVQNLSLHFGTAITTKKVSFSYGVTVHPYDCILNEYWVNRYLIEWHFDVFGLIEKGLAIDINTVKYNLNK